MQMSCYACCLNVLCLINGDLYGGVDDQPLTSKQVAHEENEVLYSMFMACCVLFCTLPGNLLHRMVIELLLHAHSIYIDY